ncbi:MAG: tRNA 2-selenouridine(34) synthase MnmH [Luminiphilus sp.]|jgi:tRNA 2-selenouridine synthase|nr:tRNA 2-selenouridine(34) synthase MnmH [Luminiphilus sp.]
MTLIDDLEPVFLVDTPLIDTRSPVEYAKGSLPNAVNLPLMNDAEREAVGTCYRHQGAESAARLGHDLVSGQNRANRIAQWQHFAIAHPGGALFCFRGGLRSEISQQWLLEAGTAYPRIEGGYKRMRRWLNEQTENLLQSMPLLLLGGQTGVAKTRVLNEGNGGDPIPGSVDLEGFANHRGSAFGRRASEQPTQISFELALAVAFFRCGKTDTSRLLLEDEGHLIGRCALPQALQGARQTADWVQLEASTEERVQHSYENYILGNLRDLEALHSDPELAFESFASGLEDSLERIKKRLGGERHEALRQQLSAALASHRKGRPEGHQSWIERLLIDYYDPMYAYQMSKREKPPIFRGNEQEVADYLSHESSLARH